MSVCALSTEDWYCSRDDGHDGPCAAWPRRPKSTRDALAFIHTMLIRHVPTDQYDDAVAAYDVLDQATLDARVAEHVAERPTMVVRQSRSDIPVSIETLHDMGLSQDVPEIAWSSEYPRTRIERIRAAWSKFMHWAKSHPGYWD